MSSGLLAVLLGLGLPLLVIGIWALATYNRFVNLRNLISNAWSNVDTELKRRYELITNLVSTVKGYAAYERELLTALTEARSRAAASHTSAGSHARDENAMVQALRQVFAVAENYPELKASEQYLELQRELINTEDRIQAARRFYNGNVKDYNNLREMVPSSLIAGRFHFVPAEYFEIEDTREREPARVGSFR